MGSFFDDGHTENALLELKEILELIFTKLIGSAAIETIEILQLKKNKQGSITKGSKYKSLEAG